MLHESIESAIYVIYGSIHPWTFSKRQLEMLVEDVSSPGSMSSVFNAPISSRKCTRIAFKEAYPRWPLCLSGDATQWTHWGRSGRLWARRDGNQSAFVAVARLVPLSSRMAGPKDSPADKQPGWWAAETPTSTSTGWILCVEKIRASCVIRLWVLRVYPQPARVYLFYTFWINKIRSILVGRPRRACLW